MERLVAIARAARNSRYSHSRGGLSMPSPHFSKSRASPFNDRAMRAYAGGAVTCVMSPCTFQVRDAVARDVLGPPMSNTCTSTCPV